MFFRIKDFEEHQNLICETVSASNAEVEVRRYIHSIVMNALEKRMEEIGAEKDWTIAPFDQAFGRNDRSLHVRYAYNANVIADVQFDYKYPISFNISRPIFAMGSLSDVADFVDACAEYLENGTIPEVKACP